MDNGILSIYIEEKERDKSFLCIKPKASSAAWNNQEVIQRFATRSNEFTECYVFRIYIYHTHAPKARIKKAKLKKKIKERYEKEENVLEYNEMKTKIVDEKPE